MALYTGPLYHLEDWSENVENHNKLADDLGGLGRDSLRNEVEPAIRVRPEMFGEIHVFSGPVLGSGALTARARIRAFVAALERGDLSAFPQSVVDPIRGLQRRTD
jgi:hypothetical protein